MPAELPAARLGATAQTVAGTRPAASARIETAIAVSFAAAALIVVSFFAVMAALA